MTHVVSRQVVGYDPKTEFVAVEYPIPDEKWGEVSALVKHADDDPDYAYDYSLPPGTVRDIMGILGTRAEGDLTFFLEAYAE